jgi:hypothetical protein
MFGLEREEIPEDWRKWHNEELHDLIIIIIFINCSWVDTRW